MMPEAKPQPQFVRDLMTVGVVTCSPATPLREIAGMMVEKCLEAVVVLDPEERHAVGWVGQAELVKALTSLDVETTKAEDVMDVQVPQVPADIPLVTASQIMIDQGVRVLFVMHHAAGIVYPAGVITFAHILRYLAASESDQLKDLGIQAERKTPIEIFIERRDAARKKNLGNLE